MGRAGTSDALRRALVDASRIDCPRCGYDLGGLTGSRCPECGSDVQDTLRRAVFGPRRRTIYTGVLRDWLIVLAGPTCLVSIAAGFWWAVHVSAPPRGVEGAAALLLGLMVLAAVEAWWRLLRRLSGWALPARLAGGVLLWGPITAGALTFLVLNG